jgi:hypothetical protein
MPPNNFLKPFGFFHVRPVEGSVVNPIASILMPAFLCGTLVFCGCSSEARAPVAQTLPQEVVAYVELDLSISTERAGLVEKFFAVHAAIEPQTRLLILKGSASEVHAAMDLLEHLNSDFEDGPGTFHRFFIKHLKNANSRDLAGELQTLIDGGSFRSLPKDPNEERTNVAADERTNSLIIESSKEDENLIRTVIDELDVAQPGRQELPK